MSGERGEHELVREREGDERLAEISKTLWIGQGYALRRSRPKLILVLIVLLSDNWISPRQREIWVNADYLKRAS